MTPEQFQSKVSSAIRLLPSEIDESEFYPREGYPEKAVAMVASKALRGGLAVCHLIAVGFYREAFGLTRSILEAFFIVKYISNDLQGERAQSVLAQPEMEKRRSPLVSIAPFGRKFSRHGGYRPMTSSRQRPTRENDLPRC
jgi:hypothetical protein